MTYRPFTLIVPYYDNAGMFTEQQRLWRGLPDDVRAALRVIVVDDGSPRAPAQVHHDPTLTGALASFRLYRTAVDVRWNWIFCRNLGAEQATTDWIVMTDMDHVIPGETWRNLMRHRLNPLWAYRLSRVVAPHRKPTKPHPNTWVMTRHMFLNRIGGYDERFSGIYGTDGDFHGRVALWAQHIDLLRDVSIVYTPEVMPDACTTTYGRKEPQDREARALIKSQRAAMGASYQPLRLTFPWAQVYP